MTPARFVCDTSAVWEVARAAYASLDSIVPFGRFFEELAKHLQVEVRELPVGERRAAVGAGNEVVISHARVIAHVDLDALAAALGTSRRDVIHNRSCGGEG